MEFGLMLGDHPTSLTAGEHFDTILRQVEASQRAGITHIFIGQHFLWPGGSRWLQPVPTLARLAGEVDEGTRLATQILIGPLHNPVLLAEELATLDIVTRGRLDVGLGLGYLEHEYAALGVPFEERVPRFEEGVELLRRLWTEDEVDFDGRFHLVHGQVHLHPLQDPHPPIWIGAQTPAGIRRAARLGDAWPITPQVSPAELVERLRIFAAERERLGKPVGRQPLRREIVFGSDREDAIARAVELAQPSCLQMAAVGTRHVDRDEVIQGMRDVVTRSFVVGSAEECAEQLREIGRAVPVNPVVTRGNWPGMSPDEMVEYVETLGRELIPALRDFISTASIEAA